MRESIRYRLRVDDRAPSPASGEPVALYDDLGVLGVEHLGELWCELLLDAPVNDPVEPEPSRSTDGERPASVRAHAPSRPRPRWTATTGYALSASAPTGSARP